MNKLLLLTLVSALAVFADPITFTLVQSDLVATPGETVTWEYDVTNNSGDTIFGLAINADPFVDGTPDATPFDFFGAGIPDGQSLTGPLFSFTADPAVSNSVNSGTFDLLVLTDSGATEDLFASYSVTVEPATTATPEPSSIIVIMLGCLGLLWRRTRAATNR